MPTAEEVRFFKSPGNKGDEPGQRRGNGGGGRTDIEVMFWLARARPYQHKRREPAWRARRRMSRGGGRAGGGTFDEKRKRTRAGPRFLATRGTRRRLMARGGSYNEVQAPGTRASLRLMYSPLNSSSSVETPVNGRW